MRLGSRRSSHRATCLPSLFRIFSSNPFSEFDFHRPHPHLAYSCTNVLLSMVQSAQGFCYVREHPVDAGKLGPGLLLMLLTVSDVIDKVSSPSSCQAWLRFPH